MCFCASLRCRLMTPAQTPLAKEVTSISLMTHSWTSRRLGRLEEAPQGAWLRPWGWGGWARVWLVLQKRLWREAGWRVLCSGVGLC